MVPWARVDAAAVLDPELSKQAEVRMVDMPTALVIGAGSWGTTLADLLAKQGVPTTIWAREPEVVESVRTERENSLFLPGVRLSDDLLATEELHDAIDLAEVVVSAVPTQFIRGVITPLADRFRPSQTLVTVSKGIEVDTLLTPAEIYEQVVDGEVAAGITALSGPSFAREVAAEHPTAVVAASADPSRARFVRDLFATPTFRVYSSDDVLSVELGGALKNVIAIGAGMVEGLRYGSNTIAALITRGLAEITRLGVARVGNPLTFAGLSGMGDLVLTCTGPLSRNRSVGEQLGKGKRLAEILDDMEMVAEGVRTTLAARALGEQLGVDLPIIEQVYQVLYEEKDPHVATQELMTRELRDEREA